MHGLEFNLLCRADGVFATFMKAVSVKIKLSLLLEPPLHIYCSLGIQRGKTDAIDALRIWHYAKLHHSKRKLWGPPRPVIDELKELVSLRKRLLKQKLMALGGSKVDKYYLAKKSLQNRKAYTPGTLTAINKHLERIEEVIHNKVLTDEGLKHQYELVTPVPNIGHVTGLELILTTNEVEESWTARRYASYCGIAPFERSSGTSLKRKPKVSSIANKEIKSLLHMAAICTIRLKGTALNAYYTRKVEEGKNKMSVINAVRNKLVQRVFACVRANLHFTEQSKK